MFKFTQVQKIHYTLRIASAMCFMGHGAFGIITKPVWSDYFAVFGIGRDVSLLSMPFLGTVDILLGMAILVYPLRVIITWLIIWGLVTALLRPLSGEPFAEFIERAGNFGAPLALLILSGGNGSIKRLFTPISANIQPDAKTLAAVTTCLRLVAFFLFLGHGWLNIIEKKSLIDQYTSLGFVNPAGTAQVIGIFEIIAALTILIRPSRYIVLALFIWKIASELFYPHYEVFEWVERGGSYGVLLALWFAMDRVPIRKEISGFNENTSMVVNYSRAGGLSSPDYNLNAT